MLKSQINTPCTLKMRSQLHQNRRSRKSCLTRIHILPACNEWADCTGMKKTPHTHVDPGWQFRSAAASAFLCLLCLLGCSIPSSAQTSEARTPHSWTLTGLEFVVSGHTGSLSRPDLQSFVNNSRNPLLFDFDPANVRHVNGSASQETAGFTARFRFANTREPRYEVWAGFGTTFSETALYSFHPARSDSQKIRLVSQTGYFSLSGGIQKTYTPFSWLGLFFGAQTQIGINISGRIRQEFLEPSVRGSGSGSGPGFQETDSWRLFSNDGPVFATGPVLGLRLQPFRRTALTWETHPSFWLSRVDGSTISGRASGGSIGVQIRLQP